MQPCSTINTGSHRNMGLMYELKVSMFVDTLCSKWKSPSRPLVGPYSPKTHTQSWGTIEGSTIHHEAPGPSDQKVPSETPASTIGLFLWLSPWPVLCARNASVSAPDHFSASTSTRPPAILCSVYNMTFRWESKSPSTAATVDRFLCSPLSLSACSIFRFDQSSHLSTLQNGSWFSVRQL